MYSYQWSMGVFKKYYHSYVRATYFTLLLLDLSTDQPVRWLQKNSPLWEGFKKTVAFVDSLLEVSQNAPDVSELITPVSTFLGSQSFAGSKWLLTALMASPILKKRSLGVPPEAAQTKGVSRDIPGQLLFLE